MFEIKNKNFFSIWLFFHYHLRIIGLHIRKERAFFNSSLPLQPASPTLRHQLGDYYRDLAFTHRQQSGSNREPLVSERKLLKNFRSKFIDSFKSSLLTLSLQNNFQKQPPEVFCKKRCSQKFRKIHRKTPVPETLF